MSAGAPVVGVGGVILTAAHRGGSRANLTRALSGAPRVCLIRRGHAPNAGRWSLPGGHLEHGETLAAAVVREVREETGLAVRVGPLIEVVELFLPCAAPASERGTLHFVVLDYLCELLGGELRAGDDAADVAWVSPRALARYGVSDAVQRVVRRALVLARERQ